MFFILNALAPKRPGLRKGVTPRKLSISQESPTPLKRSLRNAPKEVEDPVQSQSETDDQLNDTDEAEATAPEQDSATESPRKEEEQSDNAQSSAKGKLPFRLRVKKEKDLQSVSLDDMKVPAIDEGTPGMSSFLDFSCIFISSTLLT